MTYLAISVAVSLILETDDDSGKCSFVIRELSFLMLGTGVEEFLRRIGTISRPIC